MKKYFKEKVILMAAIFLAGSMLTAAIKPASSKSDDAAETVNDEATPAEATPAKTAEDIPIEAMQPAKPARASVLPDQATRADAFIAAPDWEFDGFVAGGQDSNVRNMFYLNDLLYLNIGSEQGVVTGDKLEIYKRGDKVRDPQNGRFIGYEVRRAAVVRATDRVEDEACAVRIIRTHEPVEIGDLVRRMQ
jgi:hypothetical protein